MKTTEERLKDIEDLLDEVGKSIPRGLPKQQFSEQKPSDGQVPTWDAARGMYVPDAVGSSVATAWLHLGI